LGLKAQLSAIHRYLESVSGMDQVVRDFKDIQSSRKVDRTELQKAIALCVKEKEPLIIGKLDRLSRDG
jgi:DNA invertase Pin-like site-specific DNA recombinase